MNVLRSLVEAGLTVLEGLRRQRRSGDFELPHREVDVVTSPTYPQSCTLSYAQTIGQTIQNDLKR